MSGVIRIIFRRKQKTVSIVSDPWGIEAKRREYARQLALYTKAGV